MAMMIIFVLIMMNKSIDYNSLSHLLGFTSSQNLNFPLIVQVLDATEQIDRRVNALSLYALSKENSSGSFPTADSCTASG